MKLIAIQGSPRRNGNTSIVLKNFIRGIQDLTNLDYKEVFLQELKIHACNCCGSCSNSYGNSHICSQMDDMEKLYPEIAAAELIVLATPVYFAGMSSQMKVFIDRLYALTYGGKNFRIFSEKKIVLIITYGDREPNPGARIVKETIKIISESMNMNLIGILGVYTEVSNRDIILNACSFAEKIKAVIFQNS